MENNKLHFKKYIRLIDLFGGIGGMTHALTDVGVKFRNWMYIDNDPHAVRAYNKMFNTDYKPHDIRKMKKMNVEYTNICSYLVTYSLTTDLSLLKRVEVLLQSCKELPQILLMEYAARLFDANQIEAWKQTLSNLGYQHCDMIYNATDFGLPYNKARRYILSWLGDYSYTPPKPLGNQSKLTDFLIPNVRPKYYLSKSDEKYIAKNISLFNNNVYGVLEPKFGEHITRDTTIYFGDTIAVPHLSCLRYGSYYYCFNINGEQVIRRLSPREIWKLTGYVETKFWKYNKRFSDRVLYDLLGRSTLVENVKQILNKIVENSAKND